mmetsp:Transcript_26870/g.83132  ORF Transcript_26870/g.83132 Transcript_26870/m.83132 type:complete len:235 (+) Transcript_26870:735-1439(+)
MLSTRWTCTISTTAAARAARPSGASWASPALPSPPSTVLNSAMSTPQRKATSRNPPSSRKQPSASPTTFSTTTTAQWRAASSRRRQKLPTATRRSQSQQRRRAPTSLWIEPPVRAKPPQRPKRKAPPSQRPTRGCGSRAPWESKPGNTLRSDLPSARSARSPRLLSRATQWRRGARASTPPTASSCWSRSRSTRPSCRLGSSAWPLRGGGSVWTTMTTTRVMVMAPRVTEPIMN